jgi:hypothetical protein
MCIAMLPESLNASVAVSTEQGNGLFVAVPADIHALSGTQAWLAEAQSQVIKKKDITADSDDREVVQFQYCPSYINRLSIQTPHQ